MLGVVFRAVVCVVGLAQHIYMFGVAAASSWSCLPLQHLISSKFEVSSKPAALAPVTVQRSATGVRYILEVEALFCMFPTTCCSTDMSASRLTQE